MQDSSAGLSTQFPDMGSKLVHGIVLLGVVCRA